MKDPKPFLQKKYFPKFVIDGTPGSKKGGGQGLTHLLKEKGNFDNIQVLKLLRYDRPKTRKRFHIERTALETLSTEQVNIPKLILSNSEEYDQRNSPLFIISEYIRGQTLSDYIGANGVFNLDYALDLAIQLFTILKVVHDSSMIHRDIKPDNIILTDDKTLYLVDFGLSFNIVEGEGPTKLDDSLDNSFYSLPELRIKGEDKRDKRTDVSQGFGILYYLLCGRPPLENQDSDGNKPHRRDHYKEIINPEDKLRFDLLKSIFDLAFESGKENRIQSSADALEQLQNLKEIRNEKESLKHVASVLNKSLEEKNPKMKGLKLKEKVGDKLTEICKPFLSMNSEIEPFKIETNRDGVTFPKLNDEFGPTLIFSIYHDALRGERITIKVSFLIEGNTISLILQKGTYSHSFNRRPSWLPKDRILPWIAGNRTLKTVVRFNYNEDFEASIIEHELNEVFKESMNELSNQLNN